MTGENARVKAERAPNALFEIAGAEFRLGVRRFAFWFMALIFGLIGGFYFTRFMNISPNEESLTQGVKLARNSAYSLSMLFGVLAFMFVHFTAALTVDPVLRDRRLGLLPLVLASPVKGRTYVLGKFLGAVALALVPPLFLVAAAGIAQFVPNTMVGLIPHNATGLAVSYLEFYAPFALATSALVFTLALWTGNPKLIYSLVTLFFIAYFTLLNTVQSVERSWMAYLDPAGLLYLSEVVGRGKTNVELNAILWMGDLGFLLNRAALLAAGFVPLLIAAWRFSRRETQASVRARRTRTAPSRPLLSVTSPATPLRPLAAEVSLATGAFRQLGRVAGAELRLLAHERSLYFLVPLLAVVLWSSINTRRGPFDAEVIPVSSQVARETFWTLLIFLFGTTAFFVGETAFREREEGLADLMHSYPVQESALIGGKLISNVLLTLGLVTVAFLSNGVYQLTHRGGAIDLHPYLTLYGGILLPTVALLVTLGVCLAFLAGSKPGGYALLLGLGGVLLWAFLRDHRHWLYNLPALGLFSYSDLVGLGPLRSTIVLQRLYVLAIAAFLFCAAVAFYPRTAASGGRALFTRLPGGRAWRERRVLAPALAVLIAAAALGGVLYARVEQGIGSLAEERLRVRYEKDVKPWLAIQPGPEVAGVDLELDLFPKRHAFLAAARVKLRNSHGVEIDSVHVTVNPRLLRQGEITLDGRPPDHFDIAVATFALARPMAPGDTLALAFRWGGRIPDGVPRGRASLNTFIEPGGSYLHSFAPWPWLPMVGYYAELEIASDRTRRKYDLLKRDSVPLDDGSGMTPGYLYQSRAYPYRARIRVPAEEEVLSAGTCLAVREVTGGRREFEYVSDGPIYFFAIMAGRWVAARSGPCAVHHAPMHPQNAEKMLTALTRSREIFSDLFSPYPYRELRIAEFPNLATLAMGYPTLIPFSEGIGFLTRDPKDRANLNFYVTAHEVAHQWWGTVVWPAHAKGAPVLTEGLANYATLLVAERVEGAEKRQRMFEDYEFRYLRRRDPNEERPLTLLDGDRRRDDVIWYERGGIAFYMLHSMLGEERMLAAMREFIRRYSFQDDHPTMTDFIGLFEEMYPETEPFFTQFVEGKSIPNPSYLRARKEKAEKDTWRVAFEIENRGTGDLDLVVAATAGERWKDGFHEARSTAVLRGPAPVAGEIHCDFEPTAIELDPDRTVLLQERKQGKRNL